MPDATQDRATVTLDPALFIALQQKAAADEQSVADLVNDAVRALLMEDDEDIAALDARADEPSASFEEFARGLRAEGSI